jgi:hypothetical protein
MTYPLRYITVALFYLLREILRGQRSTNKLGR